ncbi:unnamed protein product [Danaus chrysippus]|uniref:(African queen) hypothetical protein n=2 Tax=Danaus chrysippus TaxID=151541 RepID=A0A8J2QY70_9NEOP|nr:unnamed protein product [Danaus chrysippus]
MRTQAFLCVVLFIGEYIAAPLSEEKDDKIVIPRHILFNKNYLKYKAKHDIVDIMVPLNALTLESMKDIDSDSKPDMTVFLVEADLKDGKRVDKGLYLYKNGEEKMVLPNGRAAAASFDDEKIVYFGASDGLYVYNVDSKSADKYGNFSDSIIDIATNVDGKHIYILSEDHKLYNVTNEGADKELLQDVEDAQEIVLDYFENIYFYDSNKDVFIKNADGIIKVQGLPEGRKSLRFLGQDFLKEPYTGKMRTQAFLCVVLFIGGYIAAPLSEEKDDKIVILLSRHILFNKNYLKYKAKHDIVDIMVPLTALTLESMKDIDFDSKPDMTVFLVEADLKDGKRIDKGLYLYKNGEEKMVLPNGRAAAASFNDEKIVYFGASDGLYVYNVDSKSADKYGNFSDSIIDIATNVDGKHIYILSEDHKLYNVTNEGADKELLQDVEDAQEIVLDYFENIYFYDSNKDVFIKNADGIIKVRGLPKGRKSLKFLGQDFLKVRYVILMTDNVLYVTFANGIAFTSSVELSPDAKPTAYGLWSKIVHYYAYNKNLYVKYL